MRKIFERYRAALLDGTFGISHSRGDRGEDLDGKLFYAPDGTLRFSDVDYACQNRADWGVMWHLTRLEFFALSAARGEEGYERSIALLDTWLRLDPRNPNWWYNEIGMPMELGVSAILLWDALDGRRREAVLSLLARGIIDADTSTHKGKLTGANLLWFAASTLRYAILKNDPEMMNLAVSRAAAETEPGLEGLQDDGSFFQHGRRLYSGGYGRSFVAELAPMLFLTGETDYAFPRRAKELLARHILDGLRYMTHRGMLDYAVVGREYVRPGVLSARGFASTLMLLCRDAEFPRRDEILAYARAIRSYDTTFEGMRHFWVASFMTMQKNGVYISFKGAAPDVFEAELINDENGLAYNLSYGSHTTVMQSGEEYRDIWSVWDYSAIPGTTAPEMTDEELNTPEFHAALMRVAPNLLASGGYSDGDVGVLYLTPLHDGVSSNVTAFATPYGMIVLGNSIKDEKGRALRTTVEQAKCVAPVSEIPGGVRHGRVVYRSLDENAPLSYEVKVQSGSMRRNRLANPDVMTSAEILTVRVAPKKGHDRYAYVIAPLGVDCRSIEVLANEGADVRIKLPDGRIYARDKRIG